MNQVNISIYDFKVNNILCDKKSHLPVSSAVTKSCRNEIQDSSRADRKWSFLLNHNQLISVKYI